METSSNHQCRIRTDLGGYITQVDESCRRLLNMTPKGARGKALLSFFVGNRMGIAGEMRRLLDGGTAGNRIATEFQPRDRRRTSVEVGISRPDPQTLEFLFVLECA